MRERLIAGFVGLTVLVLAVFGLVRAYWVADAIRDQEQQKVQRSVALLAVILENRNDAGLPVTTEFLTDLLREAEHITYVAPDGRRVEAMDARHRANENPDELTATRVVPGAGVVTLTRSSDVVSEQVDAALLNLLWVGLVLAALAGVAGWAAARALSRPFRELAEAAGEIGNGRFDATIPRYAVPEADAIGRALHQSACDLEDLLRREREVAASASHELRTPITALRLALEDLALWPQTHPEVATELLRSLRELDRLNANVDDLVRLTTGRQVGAAPTIDLVALTHDVARRWKAKAPDRSIAVDSPGPVPVRLPHAPIGRILDSLMANAVHHGAGDIGLTVSDTGRYVEVRVQDEGTRTFGPDVFRSRVGSGLSLANETAESLGARLRLDSREHTSFTLLLPGVSAEPVAAGVGGLTGDGSGDTLGS